MVDLKEEVQEKAEERLTALSIIPLMDRPALVLRVKYPKRHVRLIWGIAVTSLSNL